MIVEALHSGRILIPRREDALAVIHEVMEDPEMPWRELSVGRQRVPLPPSDSSANRISVASMTVNRDGTAIFRCTTSKKETIDGRLHLMPYASHEQRLPSDATYVLIAEPPTEEGLRVHKLFLYKPPKSA